MSMITVEMSKAQFEAFEAWKAAEEARTETLGACGCTDYHMADCPIMTGEDSYGPSGDMIREMSAEAFDDYMDRQEGWQ